MRRFFRLMPAAWTFLLILGLLDLLTPMKTIGQDAWGMHILFQKLHDATGRVFADSTLLEPFCRGAILSVVWPFLLLFLGRRKAGWLAALGAISIAVFRRNSLG